MKTAKRKKPKLSAAFYGALSGGNPADKKKPVTLPPAPWEVVPKGKKQYDETKPKGKD